MYDFFKVYQDCSSFPLQFVASSQFSIRRSSPCLIHSSHLLCPECFSRVLLSTAVCTTTTEITAYSAKVFVSILVGANISDSVRPAGVVPSIIISDYCRQGLSFVCKASVAVFRVVVKVRYSIAGNGIEVSIFIDWCFFPHCRLRALLAASVSLWPSGTP